MGSLCGRIGSPGADIQHLDFSNPRALHNAAVSVLSRHGSVDVLVLAVGGSGPGSGADNSGPGGPLKGGWAGFGRGAGWGRSFTLQGAPHFP